MLDAFTKAHADFASAKYRKRLGAEQVAATKKRANENVEASRKYACEPCDHAFRDQVSLDVHKLTQKHLNKVAGIVKTVKKPRDKKRMAHNKASKRFYCATCDLSCLQQQHLDTHLTTARHHKRVAAAAAKAST